MSDLVERLKIEASEDLDGEVRESAIEVMREAATALTAKDKEIETLRAKLDNVEYEADYYFNLYEACSSKRGAQVLLDRAETAERERDCHKQMADKNYALWAEVSRERDEARAALKPFSEIASSEAFQVNTREWESLVIAKPSGSRLAFIKTDHFRAARAVIEQGE